MKTHTIKKNKNGLVIVTFTKGFFKKLKDSSWWSSSLTINYLLSRIKELTGNTVNLNLDQTNELKNHFGFPLQSNFKYKQHKIEQWLNYGLLASSEDTEDVLDILNHFWDAYMKHEQQ